MPPRDAKPIESKVAARTEQERAAAAAKAKEKPGKPKPLEVAKLEISDDDILNYLNRNRVGDALLYARLHRGKTVFVSQWNCHLAWAGHHWGDDLKSTMTYQLIEDVCDVYQRLADKKQTEANEEPDKDLRAASQAVADSIKRRINLLRDGPGQEKLVVQTQRIVNPLLLDAEQIDRHPYLMGCPNGVVDLRTGELRDGKPEDYLFNTCPTEYDPELFKLDNPCPLAEDFLLRSMDGDQEIVNFIWRLLGYGLIRTRPDHIFVIFWGEHGRNGKDTLIKLMKHVLGALCGNVPVEMFLQSSQVKNSSSAAADVKELCGICFAWINEAEENQRFALSKLKMLTGGGLISARGVYEKKAVTWTQTHLPIMTTNEIPKAKADDNAFWQRAIVVKWPLSFVANPEQPYERKADKHLDDKLQAEAKGVLVRMVKGSIEYLRDGGLNIPEKVQEWTKEQRASGDDIAQFLTEWCVLEARQEDPNFYTTRTQSTDLHEAFCIWYARFKDRRYSISAKKFGDLLNKKDIPTKRSNGIWRLGIELTLEAQTELNNARAK